MPSTRGRTDQYDEGYQSGYAAPRPLYGRRHSSLPPSTNRVRESSKDGHPTRPRFTKDDSYYDPRDVYYLSGGDDADTIRYMLSRRDDAHEDPYSPRQRQDSHVRDRRHDVDHADDSPYSPRRRRESRVRDRRQVDDHADGSRYSPRHRDEAYEGPYSPRQREESRTRDRRDGDLPRSSRPHSSDGHRHRHHDDDGDRHSRHSKDMAATASRRRRSATIAPSPTKEHRTARHDSHHYPPSSSKSRPSRSSTVPSHSSRRRRSSPAASSSSDSESESSPKGKKELWMGAARTALEAGAVAAVKLRNDPSPWIGMKGTKIVTTALGAAMVDTFVESRKPNIKGGMRHAVAKQVATVALGNLVTKPAARKTKFGRT